MNKREISESNAFLRFTQSNRQPYPKWQVKKLRNLAKRIADRNIDRKITRVLTNSATDGVVDQRDYFEKDIADKSNLSNYFVVHSGDYVYNPRISSNAPVGPISRNKIDTGVMSPLYTVFRFKDSENDFYEHYFNSTHWHEYMRQISNTGARHDRMSISANDFMEMPLPVPNTEEQQKIADCLSSIDQLIAAQTQKLDALKVHKKGLMQQLFPAEGETVPKLRFPEFRHFPGWEEKALSEVAHYENGKAHEKHVSETGKFVLVNSRFISTEGASRKYTDSAFCLARKGDVLMVLSDLPKGRALAKCYFVNSDNSFTVNQRVCKLSKSRINSRLLCYLLDRHPFLLAFDDGLNQTHLSKENVRRCPIVFPSSPIEQSKIADTLFALEDLIAVQAQKVDGLKAHKKGLMQQLFPSTDEVHG